MKKLKEKIDNNQTIQFIKKAWSNKKSRSWIGLSLYFIFLILLSIMIRSSNSTDLITPPELEKKSDISTIVLNLENTSRSDYQYKISINNEEIFGKKQNGTNSFTYSGYNYIYIYDKVYLDNSLNLELVTNLLNSHIPIEYITIDNILNSIKNKDYRYDSIINLDFNLYYDISTLDFLKVSTDDKISICLVGSDNVTNKIIISYMNNNYILEIN